MDSQQYEILIVEDDIAIQTMLRKWCEFLGHVVVCASNGIEAIERLKMFTPTYIITDLSMPEMDGFALIKYLRANSRFSRVMIIVLTGMDQKSVDKLNPFTVSAIISKPLRFSKLQTALHG